MFKIAKTTKEKKDAILYWEAQRKIAADIRDEYDRVIEEAFHFSVYHRIKERPDFFSPLPKNQNDKFYRKKQRQGLNI